MSNIKSPHDKLFRASLKNLEIAKDFFKIHLPKSVLAKLDLNNLEFCNKSFLDKDLTGQFSDVVYYSKTAEGAGNYIYVLTEHQSTPTKLMPLRILKYQIAIIDHHLKQHPKETTLPIVFPVLFYQEQEDKQPYPYSLDLMDLFADRIFAEQTLVKPAHLVDITRISDDDIKKHQLVGLMEYLQKHSRDRDLLLIIEDLKELILNTYERIGSDENLVVSYLETNLYYIMSVGNIGNQQEFIRQLETIPIIREKIMGSLARKFQEEGIAEGKKQEAKHIAINMLKKGLPIATIVEVTELPKSEVEKLQNQN